VSHGDEYSTTKTVTTGIDTGMNTSFYAYLLKAIPAADLVEITELFPKSQIQDLFIKEAASRRIALSSSASARSRFSRAFSFSRSFSCFAWSIRSPPNFFFQGSRSAPSHRSS
jgi:hypothetical protein